MPILLCNDLMNYILNYVPNDAVTLNNVQLSCKSFKLNAEPRMYELFWKPIEWLGKENCEGLRKNTLKKLTIPHNKSEDWRTTIKNLFYILERNTSIKILDLYHLDDTFNDFDIIGKLIKKNKYLESLYLYHTIISVDNICGALISNNTLKELDLSGCVMGFHDIYCISEILENNSSLEVLHLNEADLEYSEEGIHMLSDALKVNTSLKVLSLGELQNINEKDFIDLLISLKTNNTLTELNIGCNDLKDVDSFANCISELLDVNATLKKINLSNCQINHSGVTKIAMGLMNNKTLTHLDLRYCNAGNDGAWAIGHLLKHNNTLKDIGLYDNKITDKGAKYIYNGLVENNSLERITFSPEDYYIDGVISRDTLELLEELVNQKENLTIHDGWHDVSIFD
jgi:Ran GTPase-activating protein (RanGAP) involved in mRNA processing and transport